VWMRLGEHADSKTPLILSFIGIGLLLISGWLGGKMVYVDGVAVGDAARIASDRK